MIAAIYARKSTEQNGVADEQKSVARQVDAARAYATRKGWTVADDHVYIDDGISGAEFTNRPGFVRLMNGLKAEKSNSSSNITTKQRTRFHVLVMSEVSRLGREQIETAYALKQLSVAGVRCFSYLEDRELLMESATDKFLLGAVTFAADLEREKARQRTYDAMERKAKAGHVTGGICFGYRNVEIRGADGKRSHVAREIDAIEAEVIRRIFRLSGEGLGVKAIAKRLNDEGAPSPRAQQGRSCSWAPSSVREVLFRPLYRGEIVWNQTKKRDSWGHTCQAGRPAHDWIHRPAPDLRIVTEDEWTAAHRRLDAARAMYLSANRGQSFGRPALGNPSKYLLTNLAVCGRCGSSLRVRTRAHGLGRKHFYGCSGYHERGRAVCGNNKDVPMTDADDILIEALLDDVLDPSLLRDAVDEGVRVLEGDEAGDRLDRLEAEIAMIDQERGRLVTAIATGGELGGLLEALRTREARRGDLEAERTALRAQRRLEASEIATVRDDLMTLAGTWRRVLADDPMHARPIVSALLIGRVNITPTTANRWMMCGEGTFSGLFAKGIFPSVWRPQRDPLPAGIPFTREFRAA